MRVPSLHKETLPKKPVYWDNQTHEGVQSVKARIGMY